MSVDNGGKLKLEISLFSKHCRVSDSRQKKAHESVLLFSVFNVS